MSVVVCDFGSHSLGAIQYQHSVEKARNRVGIPGSLFLKSLKRFPGKRLRFSILLQGK